jgi:(R)-2-hydroxyacyl-CoA dehydratese activating ATPase
MKVAGIDAGTRYVHVYLMEIEKPKVDYVVDQISDPKIPTPKGLLKYGKLTGENKSESATQAYDEALKQLQLKRSDFERVWATGIYRKQVLFADHALPSAVANAHGVLLKVRNAKTIIDVGAEGCRVINISQDGKVLDIALSEKSTIGMGLLNEKAAQMLGMTVQELAESALKSANSVFQNGKYKVFGEAEVAALIAQKIAKNDIARAVYDSICARVAEVARVTGLEDDLAIVGGMAKNSGFVAVLKQVIGRDIKEPHNTDFVCAFGAAVCAAAVEVDEELRKNK